MFLELCGGLSYTCQENRPRLIKEQVNRHSESPGELELGQCCGKSQPEGKPQVSTSSDLDSGFMVNEKKGLAPACSSRGHVQQWLVGRAFQALFRCLFLAFNISCLPLVGILTFLSNGDLEGAIT